MSRTKVTPTAAAQPGHNKPEILTADMLAKDFVHLQTALDEVRVLADNTPPVAEDDEDLELLRSLVKRCQAEHKRFEAVRVENKEPYLSATRVNDSYFNALKTAIEKIQAKAELVAKRLLDKRLAEERARLAEEARVAAQAAREAAEKARQAEAERIRQEQARLQREQEQLAEAFAAPSIVAAQPTAAPVAQVPVEHFEVEVARRTEHVANAEAMALSNAALRAADAVNVKPADLARARTGDGMSTLAEIWEFEITSLADIDLNALREHIPQGDIEKAVKRFVAIHKGTRQIKGVRIFSDTKVMMT